MKKSNFSYDLEKFYYSKMGKKKSFTKKISIWLFNYGLHCVAVYRFGQFAARMNKKSALLGIIPKCIHFFLNQFVIFHHHVEIDTRAKIGRGFFLMHHYNINIGPVTIGENCTLHHNVTIGQRVADRDQGVASIGNNVWIGTGAVITGSIAVGNDATVSAGCIISKDIGDRCLAAGNPGRVIMQDYDNSSFLSFRFND